MMFDIQRMNEIAAQLGEFYHARAESEQELADWKNVVDDREFDLLLEAGGKWAGNNPEERTASKLRTYRDDISLSNAMAKVRSIESTLLYIKADVDALVEERRGLEWSISAVQAQAMIGRRQDREHRRENISQSWVDDDQEERVDEELPF